MLTTTNIAKEIARHVLPPRLATHIKKHIRRLSSIPQTAVDRRGGPRIRTDEELDEQAKCLREICDILDSFELSYFVGGGALLGSIREGDFIKWDPDVDIDVKLEEVHFKQWDLVSAIKNNGFNIEYHNSSRIDFKVIATKLGAKYEVTGYVKMGKMRYRKRCFYPDIFCHDKSEIVIRGQRFSTFHIPEKYLEWFYGDWKTPRRTEAAVDYVTDRSRTGPVALLLVEVFNLFK